MPQADISALVAIIIEMRGVEGVFEIGNDGFLLRSIQSSGNNPEAVAALTAVAIKSWKQIGNYLHLGHLKWTILEYGRGKIIIKPYTSTMIVIIGSHYMVSGEILTNLHSCDTIR